MTTRDIVRDDASAGGRWHFAGTGIFIADIRRDAAANQTGARSAYGAMGVTDDEFDAALAFVFPALQPARVTATVHAARIHCSCGIVRTAAIDPESLISDTCPCGRRWQFVVNIGQVGDEPFQPGAS
jgi:hypothetical protein